jgi:hypothetical protein
MRLHTCWQRLGHFKGDDARMACLIRHTMALWIDTWLGYLQVRSLHKSPFTLDGRCDAATGTLDDPSSTPGID